VTPLPPADGEPLAHPFREHIALVLPYACTLLAAIDRLWEPGALEGWLPAETSKALLGAGEWERKQSVGKRHTSSGEALDPEGRKAGAEGGDGGEAWLRFLQMYLHGVRDLCYELATSAFRPDFGLPPGMLTLGGQGGHPGPLAWRFLPTSH
jgi:hypothetical protein